MTFGEAIEAIKLGHHVQRDSWFSGVFVFLVIHPAPDLDPYITIYTVRQTYQAGWSPSQADMLAHDWRIVEDKEDKID